MDAGHGVVRYLELHRKRFTEYLAENYGPPQGFFDADKFTDRERRVVLGFLRKHEQEFRDWCRQNDVRAGLIFGVLTRGH
jgi:hypothetical protein